MEEKKDLREALVYLQQYGISNTLAVKYIILMARRCIASCGKIRIVWRRM